MITFSKIGELGRLGNQMFQIAATLGAAIRHNVPAKFYEWEYSKYFKVPLDQTMVPDDIKIIYAEPAFHYIEIPNIPRAHWIQLDIRGFFQSDKYFAHEGEVIRKHFAFVDGLVDPALEQEASESCSIHVRRGDYLNLPEFYPFPGEPYYFNAISRIESAGVKKFMVFSDDIPWTKRFFGDDSKFHYIENQTNVQDMHLMTKCRHNIITNSSFSWWGAWLNDTPEKIVMIPGRWFGPANKDNIKDLYCEGWIIS